MNAHPPSAARLWRRLRSRGTALILLGLVLLASVLGTFIPQEGLTPALDLAGWQQDHPLLARWLGAAGLTHLYSAWWFVALLGLLAASLVSCTLNRARALRRAGRRTPAEVRRRLWGSVVLHASFVVVLAGGLLSATHRASGYFELAEGQQFVDAPGQYQVFSAGPLFGARHSGLEVRLDRLRTAYWPDGSLRAAESDVALSFAGAPPGAGTSPEVSPGHAATVRAGTPLRESGLALYQTKSFGFAPVMALSDDTGQVQTVGAVPFATPRDAHQPAVNTFTLPGTALVVHAQLSPIYGSRPSTADWQAADLPDGGLYLTVGDAGLPAGHAPLYAGPLLVGQEARFAGYTLRLLRIGRWSGYTLVYDPGVPVIFAGFALCAAGAALLYVWVPAAAPRTRPAPVRRHPACKNLDEDVDDESAGSGRPPVLADGDAVRRRHPHLLGGAGLP